MTPHRYAMLDEQQGFKDLIGAQPIRFTVRDPEHPEARRGLHAMDIELSDRAEPYHAVFQGLRFNSCVISHVRTRAVTMRWSCRRLSARRRYLFLFIDRGEVEIDTPVDGGILTGVGLTVIPPGVAEVRLRFTTESTFLAFAFDEPKIEPPLQPSPNSHLLPYPSAVYDTAYAYLARLAVIGPPATAVGVNVVRAGAAEIARGLVLESFSHPNGDLYQQAVELIELRSRNVEFTPDLLARELGVSTRTLERAFTRHSSSMSGVLRQSRSRHARYLLDVEPAAPLRDIARRSGFGSEATLRRALLATYGKSPSTLRDGRTSASPSDGDQ